MSTERKKAERVIEKSLHTHAFWLFSTIVGLSIKEALSEAVPNIIAPPANPAFDRIVYGFRLAVFLIVIIRFYLGSVVFFEKTHAGETADENFPRKSYSIDFLFGLSHFILFFVCAFSIDIDKKPFWLFPVLLTVILLWDWPWLAASYGQQSVGLIKLWAYVNSLTALLGFVAYKVVRSSFTFNTWEMSYTWGELAAYGVVLVVSALDVWELISKREIFRTLLGWFIKLPPARPKAGAASGV